MHRSDAASRDRASKRESAPAEKNERGIRTPRRAEWQPVQVKRALERFVAGPSGYAELLASFDLPNGPKISDPRLRRAAPNLHQGREFVTLTYRAHADAVNLRALAP